MGKTHREIYFSVSAMLVESAFLYSAFALAFIISYVEDNTPVNQIFYQTIGQVTVRMGPHGYHWSVYHFFVVYCPSAYHHARRSRQSMVKVHH